MDKHKFGEALFELGAEFFLLDPRLRRKHPSHGLIHLFLQFNTVAALCWELTKQENKGKLFSN